MSAGPADALRALGVTADAARRVSHRHRTHWLVRAGAERLVLRRYGDEADDEIAWEDEVAEQVAATGWPTPRRVAGPVRLGGNAWSLHVFLPGRVLARGRAGPEPYRRLGRTLAGLHGALDKLPPRSQRPGWASVVHAAAPQCGGARRREELLGLLDCADADLSRLVRRQLEALEGRDLPAAFEGEPLRLVHGDIAPWNVRFSGRRCVGLLDFELSHLDVAHADLAFARRGYHDAVVEGYLELRGVDERHLAQLDALWTAGLFFGLWRMLELAQEKGALEASDFAWHVQQFGKTRPLGQ